MRDLEEAIKKAEQELQTALAVHVTTDLAESSLTGLVGYLNSAIDKITIVQNAWLAVQGGLDFISGKISASVKPKGISTGTQEYDLAALGSVKFYIKSPQTRWTVIHPTIDALMTVLSLRTCSGSLPGELSWWAIGH